MELGHVSQSHVGARGSVTHKQLAPRGGQKWSVRAWWWWWVVVKRQSSLTISNELARVVVRQGV